MRAGGAQLHPGADQDQWYGVCAQGHWGQWPTGPANALPGRTA